MTKKDIARMDAIFDTMMKEDKLVGHYIRQVSPDLFSRWLHLAKQARKQRLRQEKTKLVTGLNV